MTSSSLDQQTTTTPNVGAVMHHGVLSCDRTADARELATIMRAKGVHCVVVLDETEDGTQAPRVWGIVSDLGVLEAVARPGVPVTAADLAHEPAITVRETVTIQEAAETMVRHRAHHLVVVDTERHLPVGIVSTLDVAAQLAHR